MPVSERIEEPAPVSVDDHNLERRRDQRFLWVEVVDRLWLRRKLIGKWIVAGMILSSGLAYLYPKYEATAQLMPPDNGSSGLGSLALPALSKSTGLSGLTALAGDLLGSKNSGALFIKVLESSTIEDSLISRFDLRKRYYRQYWEDTRKKLRSRTVISEDKKSGVLSITVTDRDPKLAAALTGAYIEELDRIIASVATSSARRERIFLEQRLADEMKFLEDAEKKFSQFASSSMMLDVPQQTKVMVEAAARLQGEMIAARAELQGLEQIFTPENFRIKTLRAHVAELEHELGKINAGQTMAGAPQDPTSPYPSVKNLPVLGVKWADLYRTTKIHETVFELLTQQYELARIQESKEIPTVKVLDATRVSERRYPRPWMLLALGVLGAAALACLWVMLRVWWERWDAEDPRRQLFCRVYFGALDSIKHRLEHRLPAKLNNN